MNTLRRLARLTQILETVVTTFVLELAVARAARLSARPPAAPSRPVSRCWQTRVGYLAQALATAAVAFFVSSPAHASTGGSDLPWGSGVETLMDDVSGPLAHAAVIAALALTGILWAFTEHGTGLRKLSQVLFGGAVAVGAFDIADTLQISGALA